MSEPTATAATVRRTGETSPLMTDELHTGPTDADPAVAGALLDECLTCKGTGYLVIREAAPERVGTHVPCPACATDTRPDHGNCWTCGDRPPHRFRYLIHAKGRLRWAARTARHAEPKTFTARLRLLWHDFVIHGLLHRGSERCEDCGRGYPNWHADDAEWQRVMGGPWGTLCERCFTVRAR